MRKALELLGNKMWYYIKRKWVAHNHPASLVNHNIELPTSPPFYQGLGTLLETNTYFSAAVSTNWPFTTWTRSYSKWVASMASAVFVTSRLINYIEVKLPYKGWVIFQVDSSLCDENGVTGWLWMFQKSFEFQNASLQKKKQSIFHCNMTNLHTYELKFGYQ